MPFYHFFRIINDRINESKTISSNKIAKKVSLNYYNKTIETFKKEFYRKKNFLEF
jgi:hypothetical protein